MTKDTKKDLNFKRLPSGLYSFKCFSCGQWSATPIECETCWAAAKVAIQKALASAPETIPDDPPPSSVAQPTEPLISNERTNFLARQRSYTKEDHDWAMKDDYWGRNPRDRS